MLQQPLYEDAMYDDPRVILSSLTKEDLIEFIVDMDLANDPWLLKKIKEREFKPKNNDATKQNNLLIKELKETAKQIWINYVPTKERIFAHHINTAKAFGESAMDHWLDRIEYAKAIMQLWKMINSIYPYYWPMDIYRNYPRIINEYERQKREKEDKEKNKKVYNKVSKIKF